MSVNTHYSQQHNIGWNEFTSIEKGSYLPRAAQSLLSVERYFNMSKAKYFTIMLSKKFLLYKGEKYCVIDNKFVALIVF